MDIFDTNKNVDKHNAIIPDRFLKVEKIVTAECYQLFKLKFVIKEFPIEQQEFFKWP